MSFDPDAKGGSWLTKPPLPCTVQHLVRIRLSPFVQTPRLDFQDFYILVVHMVLGRGESLQSPRWSRWSRWSKMPYSVQSAGTTVWA